jgi:hypothetical protein
MCGMAAENRFQAALFRCQFQTNFLALQIQLVKDGSEKGRFIMYKRLALDARKQSKQ